VSPIPAFLLSDKSLPSVISKYDNILVGLLVSLAIPFIAYGLLLQAGDWMSNAAERSITFQPRSIALVAICLNVLPMNYFRRAYHNKSLRGLIIGTMGLAMVWFFYFGRALLNSEG